MIQLDFSIAERHEATSEMAPDGFEFSLCFWLEEVCFNAECTWLIRRFFRIDLFLKNLAIKLGIYQSNTVFYHLNAFHDQVN